MNLKFASYGILIGICFIVPFTAKADTTTTVSETTPTYADKQESNLVSQRSLMTSTSTRDYPEDQERKKFSGGYVGIGANYAKSKGKIKITISNPKPGPSTSSWEKDISSNDPGINVNVGYGHVWGIFYLGGEVFADYAPMEMKTTEITSTATGITQKIPETKISANYDVGAALKLGLVFFDRAMLYGLGGFSVTTLDTSWGTLPSESHSKVGPIFGGGFEYLITDNWSAKLQYTLTSYGSISSSSSTVSEAKFDKIDRDAITFGMAYHF